MPDRIPYAATQLARPYDALRRLPVSVVLDDVRSLYNVGAFFRTADAVGLERLHLTGVTGHPPHRQLAKTALGAEEVVPWTHHASAVELADELRASGRQLAAIETESRAEDLYDWHPIFPVCVLFGHEVDGLSRVVVDRCDVRIRIPMLGVKHSLNVATAGGVVLYELLRKYKMLHG